jgi:uncharacterized protein with NRDE domain
MCLVLIALDSHPDYGLILAANRDEFYDRPTAPAEFWSDAPAVLAGRDLKAGGTWLGVDRRGRIAAVTNYRQGRREADAVCSRGRLVSDFLTTDVTTGDYLDRVTAEAASYNGFNLVVGDAGGLAYFSNREGRLRALGSGIYGLSNHLLDTAWPKVTATKRALTGLLSGAEGELVPSLFELLSDREKAADHLLPETGVSLEWERLLSSAFIVSEGYGTRSSTVILFGRDGRILFEERTFTAGGAPGGRVRHELAESGVA